MSSDYIRFRETIESAHGEQSPSPLAKLLAGHIDYSVISDCLDQSDGEGRQTDSMLEGIHQWLVNDVDPEKIEADEKIPAAYLNGLRKLGCMRARIPVAYGGLGVSQYKFSRILELIASHSEVLALVVSVQQLGVAQGLLSSKKLEVQRPLDELARSEKLRTKYLKDLAKSATGAFCLTTPETGSDPSRLQTTATASPDGTYFLLNGTWKIGGKLYTTLGTIADVYIMLAVVLYPDEEIGKVDPRERITAFIVDRKTPGLSVKQLQFCGWRGLPNAAINLDDVRVPAENRVGQIGDGLKIAFMNLGSGRVNVAAICLGMMKQLEQIARWWGLERVQGGKPVGEHALNRVHLVNMNASIYAVESFLGFVAAFTDRPGSDIRLEAAMLKLFASQTLVEIADETLQLRGGRGYETYASQKQRGETAVAVERLYRSARMMKIGEGGANVLLLYIMRCLLDQPLSDYKKIFGVDKRVSTKVRELTALGIRYLGYCFLFKSVANEERPRKLRTHLRYLVKANRRLNRLVYGKIAGETLNYSWRIVKKHVTSVFNHGKATDRQAEARSPPENITKPEDSFEQRQVLLGHFAHIAMYLSVMTVTCQRAAKDPNPGAVELADAFCKRARCLIAFHYLSITHSSNDVERQQSVIGKKIMRSGYAGLVEEGVVKKDLPRTLDMNPKVRGRPDDLESRRTMN